MSQATQGLDVQNVSGANYRLYMNEGLKQVATMSSGTTAPSNPQQEQLWFDTNNSKVKIYSGSTWIPYFLANTSINSANTAFGANALNINSSGFRNTAIGFNALSVNTTGSQNTALGHTALVSNTTGTNNTAIGFESGSTISTGSNLFILGNSSVTSLQCQVALTVASDQRDKKNIEELNFSGLQYINALTPRKYTWDMRKCIGKKKDITEIGFVAQEVESVQSTVYDIPGMVTTFDIDYTDPQTGERTITDKKMITPALLIPVLVKAIQELSARIETLESALAA